MDQRVLDVVNHFCSSSSGARHQAQPAPGGQAAPAPAQSPADTVTHTHTRDVPSPPHERSAPHERTHPSCRRVTATAPATGGIIDVWYSSRWAVVACDDGDGGDVRVFPSLKIAKTQLCMFT